MSLVVPAVLPFSRESLEKKLALFASIPRVSRVQIDVVDGRFAPSSASWPYTAPKEFHAMIESGLMLPSLDHLEYEIDLMCFDALDAAKAWLALGATRLTFHTESATNFAELLVSVRNRYGGGKLAGTRLVSLGLALNIETSFAVVRPCLGEIEYVQFMGIAKIGRQGEPFDERVLKRIETFHTMYPALPLQVDGGVSLENAKKLLALGVSTLVVGSALLRASDPSAAFVAFEELQSSYGV